MAYRNYPDGDVTACVKSGAINTYVTIHERDADQFLADVEEQGDEVLYLRNVVTREVIYGEFPNARSNDFCALPEPEREKALKTIRKS